MRYLPAALVALATVALAPFLGKLQKLADDHMERDQIVLVLTIGFVVGSAALLGLVLSRAARSEPGAWSRAGALRALGWFAVAAAAVAAYLARSTRGTASEAAYERLHFVLYGLVALLLYRALARDVSRVWALLGGAAGVVLTGVLDEGVQWLVPLRTGELFDIALNLYGGLCGLLLAQGLPVASDGHDRARSVRRGVVVLVALALLLSLAFIDRAHLGHEVSDPEIGVFRSFHTAEQLAAANEDRTERWAREMPVLPLRKAMAIEDYFLTEAAWHVVARRDALAAEDMDTAWRENRILQKYFPVTLTIPDGGNWFRYRVPESTQDRFDAHGPPGGAYMSDADRGRIWARSRAWLLAGALGVLALSAALWRRASG